MTLRRGGGGTRAGVGITCRGIGRSQTLHDVNEVIRFAQYGMRFQYDKGSASHCDQRSSPHLVLGLR